MKITRKNGMKNRHLVRNNLVQSILLQVKKSDKKETKTPRKVVNGGTRKSKRRRNRKTRRRKN